MGHSVFLFEQHSNIGGTPAAYPDSVHGRANLERHEPEVARCWDCHGRHNVKPLGDPQSTVNRRNIHLTCSRCHEDMQVVVKYNIHAESPYQEYRKSVHGRALYDMGLLDFAAVCTDWHGVHDITKVDDPGSPVVKANLVKTCRQCHADATENFPDSWLSHYEPSWEKTPLVKGVTVAYQVLIPFMIVADL